MAFTGVLPIAVSCAKGLKNFQRSTCCVRSCPPGGNTICTNLLKSLLSRLTDTLQSVKPLKAMARENLADGVLAMETNKLNRALRRKGAARPHDSAFGMLTSVRSETLSD